MQIIRVGQNHIYTVCTIILAGKLPNTWSNTVYIYSSGQPYKWSIRGQLKHELRATRPATGSPSSHKVTYPLLRCFHCAKNMSSLKAQNPPNFVILEARYHSFLPHSVGVPEIFHMCNIHLHLAVMTGSQVLATTLTLFQLSCWRSLFFCVWSYSQEAMMLGLLYLHNFKN